MEPAVRATDLTVRFGDRTALAAVDVAVGPGEAVALLGPSGAGKTTLLRALAGLLRPAGGELMRRRSTGVIFQSHNLVHASTVARNVLAGHLGRWSAASAMRAALFGAVAPEREAAEAALARLGLPGSWERRVAELSVGERQRVAVARLLVQSPDVVLADEPVASVDPVSAVAVMDALFHLVDRGASLICSLHDPSLALERFSRVIALADGRVLYDGTTADIPSGLLGDVYARSPA